MTDNRREDEWVERRERKRVEVVVKKPHVEAEEKEGGECWFGKVHLCRPWRLNSCLAMFGSREGLSWRRRRKKKKKTTENKGAHS